MTATVRATQSLPVLTAYMARHGITGSALRPDGSLRLNVDGRYRLEIRPVGVGRLALLASLVRLSGRPARQVDDFLARLLGVSAALVRQHACGLVMDSSQGLLQLQQLLPGTLEVGQLETAVADFLNALATWCVICEQEAARCFDAPVTIG